jgi:hypothetical protein
MKRERDAHCILSIQPWKNADTEGAAFARFERA